MSEDLDQLRNKISELANKLDVHTNNFDMLNIKMGSKLTKQYLKDNNIDFKSILVGTGLAGDLSVSDGGLLTYRKNESGTMTTKFSVNSDGRITTRGGLTSHGGVSTFGNSEFGTISGNTSYIYASIDGQTGDIATAGYVRSKDSVKVVDLNHTTKVELKNDGTAQFSGLVTCTSSMDSAISTTLVTKQYVDDNSGTPTVYEDILDNGVYLSEFLTNGIFIDGSVFYLNQDDGNKSVNLPGANSSSYGRKLRFFNYDSNSSGVLTIIGNNSTVTGDRLISGGTDAGTGFTMSITNLGFVEMVSTSRGWFVVSSQGMTITN